MANEAIWNLSGVHGLRHYMWYLLQTELGWSAANYNGMVPITTPEEQPEFMDFNAPYIIYGYARANNPRAWLIESEVAHFRVFSTVGKDIIAALSMLSSKLDRQDEAAKALNNYVNDPANSLDARYKDFDYKAIWVNSVEGPSPSHEEGGRRDGRMTVRMDYVRGILYPDHDPQNVNPHVEYDPIKGY